MEEWLVKPKPARMLSMDGRLSMNSSSRMISKSSQPPAAAPKIRIIHLFAPEIIQTDAANFRDLVQRLTGKQALENAENERRRVKRSKNNKSIPVSPVPTPAPSPPQQQFVVAPAPPAYFEVTRPESSGGAATSTDSGMYGSEEVGAGGQFMAAMGRSVKLESEVFDDMIWFGGNYVAGSGAGASSCSGSDVGTTTTDDGAGGEALCGFDDLEEFVQGLYEYPHDATMMGSTTYAELFGESPLSGC